MKNLLHNNWPAILIIVGSAILILCSCNPARQIAKAEQRVLLDPAARHNVFLKELQLYPCANDSIVTYLPGRTDSVYIDKLVNFPVIDRESIRQSIDSLKHLQQDKCNEAINNAFNLGIETATKEFAKIKIPVKQPDTAKYVVVDKQGWKLLADSLGRAERHIERAEQSAADATKAGQQYKSEGNAWMWRFIGLAIAVAVGVCLFLYFKFFK